MASLETDRMGRAGAGGNASRPTVETRREGDAVCLVFSGSWSLDRPLPLDLRQKALDAASTAGAKRLVLEAGELGQWDSSLLALLAEVSGEARDRGLEIAERLPESLHDLLRMALAVQSKEGAEREKKEQGFFAMVGEATLELPKRLGDILEFLGDITLAFGRLARGRSAMRAKDLFEAMYECGVGSLAIVAVTNFLFGLILAFVGAVQLVNLGAQIYVAGLVGIGMLRVLGAVMVGVVMSGRVGAAYAALIGTMQVNEEVDALETMGIPPVDFLVLPRMMSLTLMVPLLTVVADAMGMVGGFVVGVGMLDISPAQYWEATINMVNFRHGVVGLVYATCFGVVIAIFGCYHGMRCSRSAQGVGLATTTAVVHSLVGIIVVTAIITIVCNILEV